MYVRRYMSTPAVTVQRDCSLSRARRLLQKHGFRHLPVTDGEGRLLGMVSDRDIRSSWPSSLSSEPGEGEMDRTPVGKIMTADPRSLPLASTVDDALFILEREKIGALPVVAGDGRVAGVFTAQDLMGAYRKLFGIGDTGAVLLEIVDDGRRDLLSRLARVLDAREVPFTRLTRGEGEGPDGEAVVYMRVHTYNISALHRAFAKEGLRCRVDRPEGTEGKGPSREEPEGGAGEK